VLGGVIVMAGSSDGFPSHWSGLGGWVVGRFRLGFFWWCGFSRWGGGVFALGGCVLVVGGLFRRLFVLISSDDVLLSSNLTHLRHVPLYVLDLISLSVEGSILFSL